MSFSAEEIRCFIAGMAIMGAIWAFTRALRTEEGKE